MKDILILVSKYHPGVISMAKNLEEVTGKVKLLYIENLFPQEVIFKIERRFLPKSEFSMVRANLRKLKDTYGDRIILGGWSRLHEKIVNILNKMGTKPSVMWCSTLGQMEMTCKMGDYAALGALLSLNRDGKLRYILLNERLYEEMNFVKNSLYFPHTLNLKTFNAYFKDTINNADGRFNIDLFVALRQGKNILTQISAIKSSKNYSRITLHINFSHPYIDQIIEHWGIKNIKRHSWLLWDKYLSLISCMHLSLQITHTESFNYAVAERMAMGVPTLTSYNIYNVCKDKYLERYLCVKGPDSPSMIREKIDFLLDNPSLLTELKTRVHDRINTVMHEKNALAINLLDKLFYERP